MTELHVTYTMAKAALEAAVKARGADYVYHSRVFEDADGDLCEEGCLYVHKDDTGELSPGCGVGWALNHLGVPLESFEDAEHIGVYVGSSVPGILGITISNNAARLFSTFQERQDERTTWGASLKWALERAENNGYTED